MNVRINLRESMPLVTEFIDACRAAFGVASVNESIKAGMDGFPAFYASENGHEVGTPIPKPKVYTCMTRDITSLVTAKKGRQ